MDIKLIASDVDGTLVNSDRIILPSTKKAITDFMDRGGIFVIATGRPLTGIKRYMSELEIDKRGGYIILYNGSFILNAKTLEPVMKSFIDGKTANDIISIADKYSLNITTYTDGVAITQRATDEFFMLETSINLLERKYVDSLYDTINFPVPKFMITGEEKELEKYEAILKDELDGVTVFRSEPFFLEIVPESVDKGVSLTFLEKYLGIDKSEVMACGDGFNDVPFIKAAGISVAMRNAQQPVLEAADYITLSNDEDGLGEAIRRFAL